MPGGLPEGALVTVASEPDHGYLTVRRHGRSFRVYLANIDSGWLYELNGKWLDGRDARIIASKQREGGFVSPEVAARLNL